MCDLLLGTWERFHNAVILAEDDALKSENDGCGLVRTIASEFSNENLRALFKVGIECAGLRWSLRRDANNV
jgi:hypothetical protein